MDPPDAEGPVAAGLGEAARLFAQVLLAESLAEIPEGASVTIGTRVGARAVTRTGDLWTVDMGTALLPARPEAAGEPGGPAGQGWETPVPIPASAGPRPGLGAPLRRWPPPHPAVARAVGAGPAPAVLGLGGAPGPVPCAGAACAGRRCPRARQVRVGLLGGLVGDVVRAAVCLVRLRGPVDGPERMPPPRVVNALPPVPGSGLGPS